MKHLQVLFGVVLYCSICTAQDAVIDSGASDSLSRDSTGASAVRSLVSEPAHLSASDGRGLPAIPQNRQPEFGPFSFANSFTIGNGVAYFYYREKIDINDNVQAYMDSFHVAPDVVIGRPKSTQYGPVASMKISYTRVNRNRHLFGRSSLEFAFGSTTYDGSSQAQLVGDSGAAPIGLNYSPRSSYTSDFFFRGNVEAGYCNSERFLKWAVYSGINLKTWVRDLSPSESYSGFTASFTETYSAYCIPLGLELYVPLTPRFFIGTHLVADFMFSGNMAAHFSLTDPNGDKMQSYGITYDVVTLGNKAQYRAELIAVGFLGDKVSLKVAPYLFTYSFGKSSIGTMRQYENGVVTASTTFWEPESGTLFCGVNLAVGISFGTLFPGKK
jgi:hypothetical protein